MTQEEKDLLIKDLCARLPYGVKCSFGIDDAIYEICGINPVCCGASEIQATHVKSSINGDFSLSRCKPYLFPMSSLTKAIKDEIYQETGLYDIFEDNQIHIEIGTNFTDVCKLFNILNKYHLDYNGLIPISLAIDATGKNIY